MTIESRVLGKPGNDNSVFLKIDTGQKQYRILIDTGANCLWQLPRNDLANIDHILFSHFHMDHICGFDSVFRLIYSKPEPVHIWGPSDTSKVIQARARGYTWNLVANSKCKIYLHEIHQDKVLTYCMKLEEGFEHLHHEDTLDFVPNNLYACPDFVIKASIMDHKIDCMAYSIEETIKENLDNKKLRELNLPPGKWCKEIKEKKSGQIKINEDMHDIAKLRKLCLSEKEGMKVSYVTDCIYNEDTQKKLLSIAKNSDEIIMECAYLDEEVHLATKHHHMTVSQVSTFAKLAKIKKLTLFHISDRYPPEIRIDFLKLARLIHPETHYPKSWGIEI